MCETEAGKNVANIWLREDRSGSRVVTRICARLADFSAEKPPDMDTALSLGSSPVSNSSKERGGIDEGPASTSCKCFHKWF